MMQHEFERIAGYEVSYEDYNNIIEPMYSATNLSKEDFVKVIDRKRFEVVHAESPLIAEKKEELKKLKVTINHYRAEAERCKQFLIIAEDDEDRRYWSKHEKAYRVLVAENNRYKRVLEDFLRF